MGNEFKLRSYFFHQTHIWHNEMTAFFETTTQDKQQHFRLYFSMKIENKAHHFYMDVCLTQPFWILTGTKRNSRDIYLSCAPSKYLESLIWLAYEILEVNFDQTMIQNALQHRQSWNQTTTFSYFSETTHKALFFVIFNIPPAQELLKFLLLKNDWEA